MFERILAALDMSDTGAEVMETALSLAQATSSSLILVHVLSGEEESAPSPITAVPGMDYYYHGVHEEFFVENRRQWEQFERQCMERLQSYANKARELGIEVECLQQPGSPGRTLCELARIWKADLIVMGRRGRAGLSELFLGSVSNYVTHHAHCAVMTLNPKVAPVAATEGSEQGELLHS